MTEQHLHGKRTRRTDAANNAEDFDDARVQETGRSALLRQALFEIVTLSTRNDSLDEQLTAILEKIIGLRWLGFKAGGILLKAKDRDQLKLSATANLPELYADACGIVEYGMCLCGKAAQSGKTIFAPHVDERHTVTYENMPDHGHYCVPLKADGSLLGVLLLIVPPGKPELPGRTTYMETIAGVLAGMVSRLLAIEALRESREQYRTIADYTYDWELWVAPDGILTYVSPSCERITGYAAAEFLGDPGLILRIVYPDDRPELEAHLREKENKDTGPQHLDFRIVRRDGQIRWISHYCVPVLRSDGSYAGRRASNRDITERKQTEEKFRLHEQQLMQADKMASLGILVAGVAHEINNPNNLIMLNSDLIAKLWTELLPDLHRQADANPDAQLLGLPMREILGETSAMLEGITTGSERIRKIVQGLKDFVRPDLGDLSQILNINTVVENALLIVYNLVKHSTHRFTVRYTPSPPVIKGNAQQLEQVIINLVANACEALPNATKGITVETAPDEGNAGVLIRVIDEGTGISPEVLPRIMDPFYTTKQERGGTGLGLSVCYSILQAHRGTLQFESHPGIQTVATVRLPAAIVAPV